jgi:hypothetical protein
VIPKTNAAFAMPARPLSALIDDSENPNGRSSLDTLCLDAFDSGADRSIQISTVVERNRSGHALMVTAKMSRKADPTTGVIIPLSRGSVESIDATAFKDVRFDVRGDGDYTFSINTLAGYGWPA